MGRTIAIGDIHGDLHALDTLLDRLPDLSADDTIVFLGDYVDSGPDSAKVIERIRFDLPKRTPAKIVCLRGNHEDAWLKVIDDGWLGFVMPPGNGCRPTAASFLGLPQNEPLGRQHIDSLIAGAFFPDDVVHWMRNLPLWYEDEHALYVHAGLERDEGGRWLHPRDCRDQTLLWTRERAFFLDYDQKIVVVGHTGTCTLPHTDSIYTPDDVYDVYWAGKSTYAIDTLAGKGGFLSAIELPGFQIYESR